MPLHRVHHLQACYSSNGSPIHLMEDTVTVSSTVSVFTRAETRFHLSAKRTVPFNSTGASVQSTTVCRVVYISVSNAGYTTFRGSVKGTG